ncbi:FAD-dependent monooxygenase [Actibacterium ureilyticum]|uniref:FAD-dependent monooxygenase n=1 Tax=Actibacterium ureilyticum TaxID=1590614 RepID=UPI000BAADCB1|nr:FAD-dependent monooxygenase [Actibacterium ureilyticum]
MIGRKCTVLGAGIGGLAVAIALARRGAQVTVLEQAAGIREVGAGLQISPNGAVVLDALGLGDELERIGRRARAVQLVDYRGAGVTRLNMDRGRGYHFVHRADLINMLAQAARALGVRMRLLQQVSTVEIGADGACLTTLQGAHHRCETLIGADGIHSVVRQAIGDGAPAPAFTGHVAWRMTVPVPEAPADEVTVHMGPGRHLVRYPLRDGHLMNIVAVEERDDWTEESWSQVDDPARLRAAFAGFCPTVRGLLDRVDRVHLWGLFRHPVADRWHKGGAVILGDAAHPTLPFLAQGANMALEDAWVLADALARHDDAPRAFAAYQAARRDRCARIVAAASRNARNYHLRFPPLRFAAHSTLRLTGRVAPGHLLSRFDWLYDHDVTARAV